MISSIYMGIEEFKKKYSENLEKIKKEELEVRMQNAHTNGENMSQLSIDLGYFTQISLYIDEIQRNFQKYDQAMELKDDPEFKDLALNDIEESEQRIQQLDLEIRKIKIEREFADEDDSRDVILEIRAGAGGDEASLFAGNLFDMYKSYSTKNGWEVLIIDSNVSEAGGYKEVIAQIKGKNVYKKLKYESGVHRVQRVPTTESSGRIHTSTASVAIMPEAKDIDIEIKPEDIRIDVMRASGAGGQCVNRTDSAVRITHIPTGIVVSCQETKHQAQNKEKAMANLRSRLYDLKKQEEDAKRSNLRSSQIGNAMRAEKIRTYNFPQNRVTDHRIKKSWHNIEEIMYGNLDQIVEDVKEGIQLILLENEK